jgi:oxygen-dependent protoporphyrinogen oxidase
VILKQPVSPTATKVVHWPASLPQFPVGHSSRVAAINEAMLDTPAIELCGAWMQGVGIPTCIGVAQQAATRLARQLA